MRGLVIVFFSFLVLTVYAQEKHDFDNSDINFVNLKMYSGMIINNYIYFDSFPKRKPALLMELKFGKQTTGAKKWQKHYGFPQVGVSAIGGYMGNTRQFGYMLGLLPNVALNTKNKAKWSMKIRMGLGAAYFNQPYDSISNPYNILIGSNITILAIADFYFLRNISKNLDFEFGLSAIHASNGHTGLPNVGLNMATVNTGFKYYFNKGVTKYINDMDTTVNKKLKYIIRFGTGTHKFGNERGPTNSPSYKIYDAAFYLAKPVGKLGSAMVGLGYKYYSSFYEKILEGNLYDGNYHLKSSVFTLLLAYEFEMGQMSLLAQGGINVYKPFWNNFLELIGDKSNIYTQTKGLISSRLGLQYYFFNKEKYHKNIYLGLYVKANLGGADFVSFGTGFVF